ncbi:MAG TPA: choice-of-anchor Q domain-containing protein [Acidimicrobiales bacterium]|nr:choice-of-anchor Q domain-containing protein [Acidimicrobiales bacterium]
MSVHTSARPLGGLGALVFAVALPIGAVLAVVPAQLAGATTVSVTNCSDSGAGSLRDAVAGASPGETIDFSLPSSCNGVITLTSGEIVITGNLTIDGPGAAVLAVSGDNASTVFSVPSGVTASISGLTIEDANTVGHYGGGIYNAGSLTVSDSALTGNKALQGGGIENDGGTLTVTDSTFSSNRAVGGGGIDNDGGSHAATADITGSTFSGNIGGSGGGGIENAGITDPVTLTVIGSTFSANIATNDAGGAIDNGINATADISDSTLSGNTAGVYGGGIVNRVNGAVTVTHTTFSGNSAMFGGGIYSGGTSSPTLVATILANSGTGMDCAGTSTPLVTDGDFNLDDDGSCGFSAGNHSISDMPSGLDPSGLQNHGGPTGTIALETTSPAVDNVTSSADCALNDQRGMSWPTPCDIGAVQDTVGATSNGCPRTFSLNVRWHYSSGGSSGSWSGTGQCPVNGELTQGPQAMEGDLKVPPGQRIEVGYDFTMPGNHSTHTVAVSNARVVFSNVKCASGATPSASSFTVSMPTQTYSVTNQNWYPSGNQQSVLVYQGSVAAPQLCGTTGNLRLQQGGTFSATIVVT